MSCVKQFCVVYLYPVRKHARSEGAHAFRIHTRGPQVFVSGDVAERIMASGLTGYVLEPLWVEPGTFPIGCAPGDVARLAWESGIGYLQPFVAEHLAPAPRPHGECPVEAAPMLTLPPPDSPAVRALHLDSEDHERYRTLVDAVVKSYGPGHQLLGHPAVSQELPPRPGGWTLLLQMDADHAPERLYFWAPTSDVAERRFDRVQIKRG